MSKRYIARKDATWQVVSLVPDVCKTPCGNSTPPVPYPVTALLSDAVKVIDGVRVNGDPVLVFSRSELTKTIGDTAGVAKGIKSGTVGGRCYPKTHSETVRADKKYVVRKDDRMWMNDK